MSAPPVSVHFKIYQHSSLLFVGKAGISLHIRFKFTAIIVNFVCVDTLFRPYPLARSKP